MGWQTQVAIQLQAGNTIINQAGSFTYSSAPTANNLIASQAPTSGVDTFGNNYLAGIASYGGSVASQLGTGFLNFYTGSLSGGWSLKATIETDAFGDILLVQAAGREVITANNTLDNGSGGATFSGAVSVGSLTVGGSSNTGSGNNGGVTSGPSGTVSSFPAAGPNHTHAEVHQHPL